MPRGSSYQKPYPREFKRGAVELLRSTGRPLEQVARGLGVSTESLRLWRKRAEIDGGERQGLTSDERAELRQLRREVSVLSRAHSGRHEAETARLSQTSSGFLNRVRRFDSCRGHRAGVLWKNRPN